MTSYINSFRSMIGIFVLSFIVTGAYGAPQKATVQAILVDRIPQAEVADITRLEIKRADDGRLESARVGTELVTGDEIRTTDGVEVNLVFSDPSEEERIEVFVLANSRAKIGSLWGLVGGFYLRGWGFFDTKTKYVRLAKRGTEFKFTVDSNGDVDLDVLLGVVEVEQGEFPEVGLAQNSAQFVNAGYNPSRAVQRQRIVTGLHSVRITRHSPIPEPRRMTDVQLSGLVERTNDLLLATMPGFRPSNRVPTTFASGPDLATSKKNSEDAFRSARMAAIKGPTAKSSAKLGDSFRDLGSGERAIVEYKHAVKSEPKLSNSIDFLIGESEAYRLSGNLKKASERISLAAKLFTSDTSPFVSTLYYTATGNIAFDKGNESLASRQKEQAAAQYLASLDAYRAADKYKGNDSYSGVLTANINNVELALYSDKTNSSLTSLNGTYDGELSFLGVKGKGVLIVTGNRFRIESDKVLTGSLTAGKKLQDGSQLFDLEFDSGVPAKFSVIARCETERRLMLKNTAAETTRLQFSAVPRQMAAKCMQPSTVKKPISAGAATVVREL